MNKKYFEELIDSFLKQKKVVELRDFLFGILTPKEIEEISTRLQIIKLLKKDVIQHKIAEKLGVGVATVTRGSRELKLGRFKNV